MKKKSSLGKVFVLLLFLAVGISAAFVYLSPMFEKNKPIIELDSKEYWNLKSKLNLKIKDDSGIKYYRVVFKDGLKDIVLDTQILQVPNKEINLEIAAPKLDMFFKSKEVEILVEAIDSSKWNMLEGNRISKSFKLKIDRQKPVASIVSNSYAIRRGGSALVIVKVDDENLKDAYITFNDEQRFELIPFYKEKYYASLIAWPVKITDFRIVNLMAIDKADNLSITKVPLYIRPLKDKASNIKISDSFIENVSTKVLNLSGKEIPEGMAEIFIKQNNILRSQNVQKIEDISKKYMDRDVVFDLSLLPFKRLTNAATAGHYAQKRAYYHNGVKIDEAWHLGVDWASVKKANIKITNQGRVIFDEYLGIYGNTVIVDHGFGLQSLYAHVSSSSVNVGDNVKRGQIIANTGTSGAVLGDHLHFGVLVQGVEVNPLEWMDKNWIRTRVTDIISEAKEIIGDK